LAVRPIRIAGDPVLRQKCKKVRVIDESIQTLIDDMIETMRDAPGVGLAANQIGVPLRVIVIEVPKDDEEDRDLERPEGWDLYVLINPQIVKRSGHRKLDEGCLSVPGYKALTPRSESVTVKGLDRNGKEVRIKAENNLLAEAIEHEVDHINGILYVDHLESQDELVRIDAESPDEDEDTEPTSASGRPPAGAGPSAADG
jgi:peptide deformylase